MPKDMIVAWHSTKSNTVMLHYIRLNSLSIRQDCPALDYPGWLDISTIRDVVIFLFSSQTLDYIVPIHSEMCRLGTCIISHILSPNSASMYDLVRLHSPLTPLILEPSQHTARRNSRRVTNCDVKFSMTNSRRASLLTAIQSYWPHIIS